MKVFLAFIALFSLSLGEKCDCNGIKYPGFMKLGTFIGSGDNQQLYEKTYWLSSHFKAFWDQAKTICHSYGMEFVSVDSLEESNKLLSLCQENSDLIDIWTHIGGITTVGKSKTEWYWVESGNKLSFDLKFGTGQPDFSSNNEYCLSLGKNTQDFFYNDIPCYGLHFYNFICQTKVNFPSCKPEL